MLFLLFRIMHIVTGVFWAGSVFFMVSFLLPAFGQVGPGAGPVQAELARRKLFQKLPAIGIVTILSGFYMYYLRMRGTAGWAPTMEARVLGTGGLLAVVAIIIGATFARPNQDRVAALMAEAGPMPAGPEKDAKFAQAGIHRKKVVMAARIVATLLGVTVIAMASARYL